MNHIHSENDVLLLKKGEGREYKLDAMTVIFKADVNETDDKYSVSEWWLEPCSHGPGEHQHEDKDHIFYILDGTVSVFINGEWIEAERGTFIRIAKNTIHTFANKTNQKAGFLNFDAPGGFERDLPSMVKWFEENK